MSGAPGFAGTRVPVRMLLDNLKYGETIEDFLDGAPSITLVQAELFLELASQRLIEYVLAGETDPNTGADDFERLSRSCHGDSRAWKFHRGELHERR